MSQIFISYSRRDNDFVDRLVTELEARGVDVWVDTGEILAGEAWRRTIVEAIRSCQVFVILISPKSVQSENVTKELTLAEQYDKSVLPIVIQDVEIPPSLDYQLAGLHYQTFAEGGYFDWAEQVVCIAASPATRQLAAQVAALLNISRPTQIADTGTQESLDLAGYRAVVSDDAVPEEKKILERLTER